jgi:Flp pilus assembly protein TadG
MRKQLITDRGRSGVAIVEFSLALVFLTPLLLGTFVFGFKLIRSIEMTQITRDLGHMYIRGIDFRNSGPQQNAQTLAAQYSLSSTGTSVVRLSQARLATQADCDAAHPSTPGQPCTNLNKVVFVEQLTLGNSSVGNSVFGTPPLQSDKTVSVANLSDNSSAQANGFSGVMTLNTGEIAYVAEMINQTPELNIPGLSGAQIVYSRTIF